MIVLNKKILENHVGDDGATKYVAILLFISAVQINLKRIGDRQYYKKGGPSSKF